MSQNEGLDNESTFQVRDRRRFQDKAGTSEPGGPDPEPSNHDSATGEPESSGSGEEAVGPSGDKPGVNAGGVPEISTVSLLYFTIVNLSHQAWQDMGLLPNATTGKVERKLADARLAVDAIGALTPLISPQLEDADRRQLQTQLANLRLNYVEQAKRSGD